MAVARLAGAPLSRLAGRGGGTTLPGKILDDRPRRAGTKLAARLPLGSALVSATNGKTTTAGMARRDPRPRVRLAHNRAGANLVSGVASALLAAPGAELGLFEVDEGAFPTSRARRPAVSLGNLFRDQLDRYGELELIAERWRESVALPAARGSSQRRRPARGGHRARTGDDDFRFGLDDPALARGGPPPRRRLEVLPRCGTPTSMGGLRRPSRGLSCPNCGHARPAARRRRPARSSSGLEGVVLRPGDAAGERGVGLGSPRALQRLQRDRRRRPSRSSWARRSTRSRRGSRARPAFGRFERIAVGRQDRAPALDQEPCGRERGRPDARPPAGPPSLVVALNDAIADGRDVSWIWDVDFEPLLSLERLVVHRRARGGARAPLQSTAGSTRDSRSSRRLERALDRGLELTPAGGELVVLPTYTAMLALRAIVAGAAPCGRTGSARVRISVGAPLSRLPQHLRRSRQHRGPRAPRGGCAASSSRSRHRRSATRSSPAAHDLLYVGGGQDREQALIAADLAAKGEALRAAVAGGAAVLAVCGGYQLLGRFYRGRDGGAAGRRALPARDRRRRAADDRRRAARVRARAGRAAHARRVREPRGRTVLDAGAEPLGAWSRVRERRRGGFEGCRVGRAVGTYLHGPLLPRNPWLADLAAWRRRRRATRGDEPAARLEPLGRTSSRREAHAVAAARGAEARGGRPRWALAALGRPEWSRGRRSGRPAASAPGSAGSAGAARPVELVDAEQAVAAHRLVLRGHAFERARRGRPAKIDVDDVLAARRPGRDRLDERDGALEREIVAVATRPTSSASSRCSASSSVSPPLTPPPGSSQYSRPRLLVAAEQNAALPAQDRGDPDARLRHALTRPTIRSRATPRSLAGSSSTSTSSSRDRRARRAGRCASPARRRTARRGPCSAG